METKLLLSFRRLPLCFMICFLFALPVLPAAEPADTVPPAPILTEALFVQRLSWSAVSYASEYRVTLEKQVADDSWIAAETFVTADTFAERSLNAGSYRFRVQVINLFKRAEEPSAWKYFEILQAVRPFFNLTESAVNFALKPFAVFTGGSMAQNARVVLINALTGERLSVPGFRVDTDGASLTVPLEWLTKRQQGVYSLVLENPGGLSAAVQLTLTYKPRIWSLSAGYAAPLFPTAGSLGSVFFNKQFFPYGAVLVFESLPFEQGWGRLGFALSVQGSYLMNQGDVGGALQDLYVNPKVSACLGTVQAELVYELPLVKRRFFLRVKAGAGISALVNFKVVTEDAGLLDTPFNGIMPSFSGGLSLRYVFSSGVFVFAGADYVYMLDKQIDGHSVIPQAGIGFRW